MPYVFWPFGILIIQAFHIFHLIELYIGMTNKQDITVNKVVVPAGLPGQASIRASPLRMLKHTVNK
ncbi:MAG: hypothetical protein LBK18_03525, partial [Prevotellaceae bacterium]|nr:hypothetical protein [Prevotellaceae bacterium]